jgi:hypothetical protein
MPRRRGRDRRSEGAGTSRSHRSRSRKAEVRLESAPELVPLQQELPHLQVLDAAGLTASPPITPRSGLITPPESWTPRPAMGRAARGSSYLSAWPSAGPATAREDPTCLKGEEERVEVSKEQSSIGEDEDWVDPTASSPQEAATQLQAIIGGAGAETAAEADAEPGLKSEGSERPTSGERRRRHRSRGHSRREEKGGPRSKPRGRLGGDGAMDRTHGRSRGGGSSSSREHGGGQGSGRGGGDRPLTLPKRFYTSTDSRAWSHDAEDGGSGTRKLLYAVM